MWSRSEGEGWREGGEEWRWRKRYGELVVVVMVGREGKRRRDG